MSSGLKLIYTFFLGILVVIFVALGIAAFYTVPTAPEGIRNEQKPLIGGETPAQLKAQEELDKKLAEYEKDMSIYTRNVFIIALTAAIIILVISLTTVRNIDVIADGLLLGGTLTLFYSIGMGARTPDNKFRFLAVSVGLLVTLAVGYIKFIKGQEEIKKGE
ncbi:MAG: hypothetical protein V1841_00865 [Patescibacteria group bacterium]